MKDRILKLLGTGLSQQLVASAVGVSPSYISQLLAEKPFADEVAALQASSFEELRHRDDKYDSIEDSLLERLETLLPMMFKPRDVLFALQIINSAKRRSEPILSQSPSIVNNFVTLQLPAKTVNTFELSQNTNEVVAIDNKSIAPMPSSALMRLVESEDTPSTEGKKDEQTAATVEIAENHRLPARIQERTISEESI